MMQIKGIKIIPATPERQEETVFKLLCDLCKVSEGVDNYGDVKWDVKEDITYEETTVRCEQTNYETKKNQNLRLFTSVLNAGILN